MNKRSNAMKAIKVKSWEDRHKEHWYEVKCFAPDSEVADVFTYKRADFAEKRAEKERKSGNYEAVYIDEYNEYGIID